MQRLNDISSFFSDKVVVYEAWVEQTSENETQAPDSLHYEGRLGAAYISIFGCHRSLNIHEMNVMNECYTCIAYTSI